MKLYLRDGDSFDIKEGVDLRFLNLDQFIAGIIGKNGHFMSILKYELTCGDKAYTAEAKFDSYHGITNTLDENSPIQVEVVNFGNLKDENAFIEINII